MVLQQEKSGFSAPLQTSETPRHLTRLLGERAALFAPESLADTQKKAAKENRENASYAPHVRGFKAAHWVDFLKPVGCKDRQRSGCWHGPIEKPIWAVGGDWEVEGRSIWGDSLSISFFNGQRGGELQDKAGWLSLYHSVSPQRVIRWGGGCCSLLKNSIESGFCGRLYK